MARRMTAFVDPRSERIAKRFEVPMLIAAVLVIPTIIIEEAEPGEPLETLGVSSTRPGPPSSAAPRVAPSPAWRREERHVAFSGMPV